MLFRSESTEKVISKALSPIQIIGFSFIMFVPFLCIASCELKNQLVIEFRVSEKEILALSFSKHIKT